MVQDQEGRPLVKLCVYYVRNRFEILDGEGINKSHLNNSANWPIAIGQFFSIRLRAISSNVDTGL